jgi:hypothetical protein
MAAGADKFPCQVPVSMAHDPIRTATGRESSQADSSTFEDRLKSPQQEEEISS